MPHMAYPSSLLRQPMRGGPMPGMLGGAAGAMRPAGLMSPFVGVQGAGPMPGGAMRPMPGMRPMAGMNPMSAALRRRAAGAQAY